MSTLDQSIGAVEIGVLLSSVLYGVLTVQAFLYTDKHSTDPLYLRIMVVFIWTFETAHTVFVWVLLYSLTVTNYGKPAAIEETPWSLATALPFTSFLGAVVQVFFANRVRVLSGRLIIPIIAWLGAVLRCAFGITLGVVFANSHSIPRFFANWQWLVTTQFTMSAVIDILNTASLCFYLLRQRTDFKATQRMVDKLVMYTVETGLITSLCAVAIVVTSLVLPHTFIDIGIFIVYPKLFSNSFFTALNARQSIRKAGTESTNILSTGIFSQPHTDPENSTIALPLSPRRRDFLESTPSRTLPASSSFDGGTTKVVTIS